MTITVHALIESILGYGLTLTGSAATMNDLDSIDRCILNPVARRVAGVGMSVRREVLYSLADPRSVQNHYVLKAANVIDRMLRAKGAQAQQHLQQYLEKTQRPWRPWQPSGTIKQIAGRSQCEVGTEDLSKWLRNGK